VAIYRPGGDRTAPASATAVEAPAAGCSFRGLAPGQVADSPSLADLHRVIQLLMAWDDDHLHRFRIHGRDYGIAYVGGASIDEDAAAVQLAQFEFRPAERFLYDNDFTAGWQVEVRVEKVNVEAP
jgi:hypothetical protein